MWTMFRRAVFKHHLHNMQAFHVPVSQLASALPFSAACLHAPWHVDKLGPRQCCGWPGRPGQGGLVHKVRDRQQSAVNENAPSQPSGSTSASSWDWKTEAVEVDMEIQPLAIQTTTIVLKRTVHVRHGWATLVPGKTVSMEWFFRTHSKITVRYMSSFFLYYFHTLRFILKLRLLFGWGILLHLKG